MHTYTDIVKPFLCGHLIRTRKARQLTKTAMSKWLRIDPRSYPNLENGRYCLSAPSLLFFLSDLDNEEVAELLHQFRVLAVETKDDLET